MIRLGLTLFIIFTSSCKKAEVKQYLTLHSKDKDLTTTIKSAEYNINKVNNWYEFTLRADTKESDIFDYAPNVEITVICNEYPKLEKGKAWKNQPCYIEEEGKDNLTNFYMWTHEGFDNYDLTILDVNEETITCKIVGYIELNHQEEKPTKVSIQAKFIREKEVERSFY